MALQRHHVDHLVAVARFGNVTRAAAALGVTQPALSRSVREIERKLGLRLFERVRSGVIPTPACRRLLTSAQRLLGDFDALEREAQSLGGSFDGGFAIGLGPAVVAGSAMRAVGRLLAAHPRLACRVVTASALELLRRLREHELEFFVGDLTPLAGADEAFELEAFDYDGVLLCRAGHPALAARSPLAAALDHPIALLGPPPAGLAAVRALLREARPELPSTWQPSLVLDDAGALVSLMLEADAIGGSAAYAHAEAIERGTLVALPVPRPVYRGRVGPVRLAQRALPPAAERLWREITLALRRDLRAGGSR